MTPTASPTTGQLSISRTSQWFGRFRSVKVWIDGTLAGSIPDGAAWNVELPPGTYALAVSIEWCFSETLQVTIAPGRRTEALVSSPLRGWRYLMAVHAVFGAPGAALQCELLE